MARGYTYAINSDASGFISGARKAGQAAEDFSGSLEDVARNAGRTDDDVQQAMKNISADAKGASNDLEQRFSQAFEGVRKDAKRTGDVVDTETRSGTRRAGEATGEFKQEALSNLSEVTSSFSGDMTQAVDGVQGLLGGLAGSAIPGVSAAAGVAAIGFGAAFGAMRAEAEATKERVGAIFDDLVTNQLGTLSEALINSQLQEIVQDTGKVANAQKAAKETGLDYGQVLRAMAGDVTAADKVTRAYDAMIGDHKDTVRGLTDELATNKDRTYARTQELYAQVGAEQRVIEELEKSRSGYGLARADLEKATEAQRALNDALDAGSNRAQVAKDRLDALREAASAQGGDIEFTIKLLNYDQTYKYLSDMETLVRSITGDKTLRIGRGLGGGGGQVL